MSADTARPAERLWLLALAGALAGGLALRLLFLGDTALWLDEAFSVWFSQQSWHDLWHEVPRFETHPPLYYSLLKLWRVVGSDEAALRLPSVLASVATIGLVALTAALAAPKPQRLPMAATAAFLLATSPSLIALAQQARPYALLMFGMSLALASAMWIVTNPERAARPLARSAPGDRLTPAAYFGLGLGLAILLWMHNVGAIFVAALGAVLIAWWAAQGGRRGPLFRNLLAAALLAFVLYAPNLPTLVMQTQAVAENFWLDSLSAVGLWVAILKVYGQWLPVRGAGLPELAAQMLLAVPLALLGAIGAWRLCNKGGERRWAGWLLLGGAFGSFALMLAISYAAQPVLIDRTLSPAQLPWVVLCAAAPFGAGRRRQSLGWALIAAVGLLHLVDFVSNHATQAQRDALRPWRAIATSIAASDAAGAPVVIFQNGAALSLDYYDATLDLNLAIHPLPEAYPARGAAYHYPVGGGGEAGIDETVLPKLHEVTAEASTVWFITRLEPEFDPQQIVRRALAERFPCAESASFGQITLTRFDRPASAQAGAAEPCPQRSAW